MTTCIPHNSFLLVKIFIPYSCCNSQGCKPNVNELQEFTRIPLLETFMPPSFTWLG